jgi:hypothetical protein
MTKLKSISKESVPHALEKAERYRLLNEPFLAESICLDVLAVEPESRAALVTYVLALCDQVALGELSVMRRAQAAVAKLKAEYERSYYGGIVFERRAMSHLHHDRHGARDAAYFDLRAAMDLYDKAAAQKPDSAHDDAVLRYNTCVRLIELHDLREPAHEPGDYPLE